MDKAAFSLIGYKFNKVILNLENLPSDTSFILDFDPSGEYIQAEGIYHLKFTFQALKENEEIPTIQVVCMASFKFKENIPCNEIPNFFYPNSIAILFPYVRAFVSTLTLQANIKPILLPTLNLSSLQDMLKNKTSIK